MDPVLLVLDAALIVLAAARLTRLATVDTIGHPFRQVLRLTGLRLAGDRGLAYGDELATCPHCMGFWIALAVVGSYAAWAGPAWRLTAGVLAVAYLAGHLVAHLDTPDPDLEDHYG